MPAIGTGVEMIPVKSSCLRRATLALMVGLLGGLPVTTAARIEAWLPIRERALAVAPGSALDFSTLVEAGRAGQFGWAQALPDAHIGFEKRPAAQRFLAASLVFSAGNGKVPDHAGADTLVEQLRRTGYNLVRLHFVDATLMSGRNKDFDFDPEQLDRLHYLLAALAQSGIYWWADGLTSDNAAWGDVQPHRWVKKYQAKLEVLSSEAGFQHWAGLVQRLWGTRNPYTGKAPLDDPAMLGMILVNEGSLAYMATISGGRYPEVLEPLFRDWLRVRYGNDAALRAAWGADWQQSDALAKRVELPAAVRGRGMRDTDFARFVVDLERNTYQRMAAQVRALGFGGLTTAFDNWGFVNADITRAALPWVDMHSYHALPSNHGQVGSRIAQTSVHNDVARYVRELTSARQWGKPFTVSEYGQPFWNRYRHESAVLVPALAALQGWDAICQFAETPFQLDYGTSPFTRLQAIYPYGVGTDPIARAGERLAALLFLRGDVAAARGRIRLHLDADRALARSGGWEQVPEGLSRLGLVTGIGLDFGPMPAKPVAGELAIDLTGARPAWWSQLESGLVKAGVDSLAAGVAPLREAGIIGADNRTQPSARLYQSDTGQLTVDSGIGLITLATPRTAVLVLRAGASAAAGPLSVRATSAPALVAVAALDEQPIASSRRLLLWVLTDAINSGMSFEDAERTTIRTLGNLPPMLQPLAASIRLEHGSAARLRAWPLSLAGERGAPLKLEQDGGAALLKLDTAALPDGPALYFELAIE
jgi:hypothetical protein